jgi:outer membrane protein assembly complex protein YaeT
MLAKDRLLLSVRPDRLWWVESRKRDTIRASLALAVALVLASASLAQLPPPPPGAVTEPARVSPPISVPTSSRPAPAPERRPESAPPTVRQMVSDIIIQGNRNVSTEWIKNNMHGTRIGKEFIPERLQEDIRVLAGTRQFANIYADKFDDGKGGIRVVVYVRDYPSVVTRVAYQGNVNVSNDDLAELTGIRVGMPCNPIANKVACRRIVQRYHEDGRPLAFCELLRGAEVGDTEVIFNITEGPKVRIRGIDFVGNTFVSGPVLKTHIQSSSKFLGLPIGGTYNSAMLDHDINELIKYYRAFGYHDVRVSRELVHHSGGRDVTVIFHIHEGVRYRLANSPHVYGVKSAPAEAFEAMGKMKAGEYYDQATIEGDAGRIRDWLGVQGREARVMPVPVYDKDRPGIVQVRYEVEERPPARVGEIFIIGNERTRQPVILRQVPLYPGQVLSFPAVREAERNLARLNIFETTPDGSVRPTITVLDNPLDPDNPVKDILVTVQEASTGSLMFGLGVNSDSGLTGSIILNERNFDLFKLPTSIDDFINGSAFRGGGQEFRVEAVPGTQLQRYVVSLREPFLFDSPYSLLVSGYYYQRFFNEYSEERTGGRFTLGRKVSDFWSVLGTIRLENVQVYNVPDFAPPDYLNVRGGNFLAGFRVGATRDSRDSLIRPTSGSLIDLGFEYVTGDNNFPLATADISNYFTVWQRPDGSGRHVLALHNQLGWAGSTTPVYERFFAGGFRSLRGFQFRGVSPDINGFKVGGDFMLLHSLEYQVPIRANDQISLVGFVDAGTVARRIDEIENYRVSVGFGVRFVVPMLGPVPIALDFGFPIARGPHDLQQVFNFFMGWQR